MSNFLSQDDIDALLGAAVIGGGNDTAAVVTGGMPSNVSEVVENIVKGYITHINSVGTTNLNREVTVELDYIDSPKASAIINKIGSQYLIAEIPFSGEAEGSIHVMSSKGGFAVMSDLMVGGNGSTPYSDDCKDAVSELLAQVSGAFATELGGKVGSSVTAGAPAVLDSAGVEVYEGYFSALCSVKIADIEQDIKFVIAPDETLIEKLSAEFGGKSAEPEPVSFASAPASAPMPASQPFSAPAGNPNSFSSKFPQNVDMLLDIELEVAIELGKANVAIKNVLDLAPGSLVELDRMAGEPVDLLVNNKVVAKGEVVVIDENFGVRIISLVSPEERIKSLR